MMVAAIMKLVEDYLNRNLITTNTVTTTDHPLNDSNTIAITEDEMRISTMTAGIKDRGTIIVVAVVVVVVVVTTTIRDTGLTISPSRT